MKLRDFLSLAPTRVMNGYITFPWGCMRAPINIKRAYFTCELPKKSVPSDDMDLILVEDGDTLYAKFPGDTLVKVGTSTSYTALPTMYGEKKVTGVGKIIRLLWGEDMVLGYADWKWMVARPGIVIANCSSAPPIRRRLTESVTNSAIFKPVDADVSVYIGEVFSWSAAPGRIWVETFVGLSSMGRYDKYFLTAGLKPLRGYISAKSDGKDVLMLDGHKFPLEVLSYIEAIQPDKYGIVATGVPVLILRGSRLSAYVASTEEKRMQTNIAEIECSISMDGVRAVVKGGERIAIGGISCKLVGGSEIIGYNRSIITDGTILTVSVDPFIDEIKELKFLSTSGRVCR